MRFLTVDHGAWLSRIGIVAKARMFTIGNPLIAQTMIAHDLGAGLLAHILYIQEPVAEHE
jgi:hypothetical protein